MKKLLTIYLFALGSSSAYAPDAAVWGVVLLAVCVWWMWAKEERQS